MHRPRAARRLHGRLVISTRAPVPRLGFSRPASLAVLAAARGGSSNGGYSVFAAGGRESSTVATWLKAAGYRTILLGKYVNGYPSGRPTYVPPGWDDWQADFGTNDGDEAGLVYYDYFVNDNGAVTQRGDRPSRAAHDRRPRASRRRARSRGRTPSSSRAASRPRREPAPTRPARPSVRGRRSGTDRSETPNSCVPRH